LKNLLLNKLLRKRLPTRTQFWRRITMSSSHLIWRKYEHCIGHFRILGIRHLFMSILQIGLDKCYRFMGWTQRQHSIEVLFLLKEIHGAYLLVMMLWGKVIVINLESRSVHLSTVCFVDYLSPMLLLILIILIGQDLTSTSGDNIWWRSSRR